MAGKKTVNASSIKTQAQFEKAVREGASIRFDGGYPKSAKSTGKGKKKS